MEPVREWMEELTRFTLDSRVNETLGFDLGLSKDFCSYLLKDDTLDYTVPPSAEDSFQGVPRHPLFMRLAAALYRSIISGKLCVTYEKMRFLNDGVSLTRKEDEWDRLLQLAGGKLLNTLRSVSHELRVREPFFSLLKDGVKTIEGMCTRGDHYRIEPGDLLLVNKTLALQAEDVRRYASFSEMLKAEGLAKVLPGVICTEDGVKIYRAIYSEEEEMSDGVHAISVLKLVAQPYLSLARILSGFNYEGVQSLLGLARTAGTVVDALPPPRSVLFSSFSQPLKPNIKGAALTCGARALAKHAGRCNNKYWGILTGNDSAKNRFAMDVINRLVTSCCWSNVHIVPPHGIVFEIRVADGYGARWSKDGTQFIGFLEPYMEDGHSKGWKH